jgi:signal transduction histidine kinase
LGLSETLLISVTKMCKASGIRLIEECENVGGFFKKNDEIHLYRIVQEILNNTIKHASASEVRLSIRKVENGVEIDLSDNGVGLEQGSGRQNGERASKMIGFGLNNIRHPVKGIGGEVLVESTPNMGTRYLITFN